MIGEPDLKILVLSDSHRAIGAMYDAAILEDPDAIMHLGDHVSDAEDMVRGNCDFGAQAPETILTELGGVRLFLTHGHLFGVKSGMSRLKLEADRVGADIALFGHTHRPFLEEDGGVWYMNPGAARDGRYGVIEMKDGAFTCELKELPE